MGALLKIVQAPTVVAQEAAFRVLNAGLVDRLGAMNAAVRTLRDMGYRVIAQTLFPVRGGNPEVLIDRDRQASIGPLLDRSRGRQWRNEGGKKFGFTEFQGVTVTWEEV
jgi:hypothetical protein